MDPRAPPLPRDLRRAPPCETRFAVGGNGEVPDELVRSVSLVGPRGYVKERLAAFAEGGATTLLLQPLSRDRRESVRFVEELQKLLP